MKKCNTLLFTLLLLASCFTLQAQSTTIKQTDIEVQVTYAERIGTTLPIRDLVPMQPADPEKRKRVKLNKEAPKNFAGRGKYVSSNPNALPQGEDAVRQHAIRSTGIDLEPLVNIEGLDSGSSPQDPTGDIGRDHYVQAINATAIGVFDKEGELITSFAANTIWSSIGFSSAGDPIVLYDQEAQRWIITEFPSGNQLLVGISETSDPLGSYTAYNFGTPSFPDYPKYGIWSSAYSVTTNEQGPSNLPCYFINRQDLLNGEPTVQIQRIIIPGIGDGPGFQVATPVDWTGLTPPANSDPLIVSLNDDAWGAVAQDQIDVHSINIDWADPNATTVTTTSVVTSPYDTNPCSASGPGFSCIPQLNGTGLDGLPEVIMNQVHYRNFGSHEAMVMNFITDVSGGDDLSGIRWMEMRRTPGEEDWTLYQEGTFAPDDGRDRFMGAICMDGAGNIGLAYAISSEDMYASLRFTGRRASDPLGEMTVNEYNIVDGLSTLNTFSRFGDYAHMSVDPSNDRTFWFTAEYAGANGNATRVVAFELRRDTTDIAPIALNTPQSGPSLSDMEQVEIQVQNLGLDTQSVFQVGYIFENSDTVIEDVTFELFPDSIYTHTFGETVDMSTVGDYEFKLFTNLDGDQAPLNDTLRVVRSNLPRFDAGVTNVFGIGDLVCGDTVIVEVEVTNFGTDTLTSFDLVIEFNGIPFTQPWAGELVPGATQTVELVLPNVVEGENDLTISTNQPNGNADEAPQNDTFSRLFDAIADGVGVTLQLLTDDYPNETTWQVTNAEGETLFEGGPYSDENTLILEEFCLNPDSCYTFSIFDSYGDGICCGFGEGNYSIVDENGLPLLNSTGEFGFEEVNQFCATFSCMLEAEFDIAPVSTTGANDGALFIEAQNGIGPYQYSINGGETFSDQGFFTDLSAGDYEIVIQGDFDCEYTDTITIPLCTIELMGEVTDVSEEGAMDAIVQLSVNNGTPPFEFSIDQGNTFQSSSVFSNLSPGDYDVIVRDAIGCTSTITVTVDVMVSATNNQVIGNSIEVLPNPTDGVFQVNVKGLTQSRMFLPVEIFNAQGQRVQVTNLTKYNDTFTGMISLYVYPDGVYFLRFHSEEMDKMVRVVKQ